MESWHEKIQINRLLIHRFQPEKDYYISQKKETIAIVEIHASASNLPCCNSLFLSDFDTERS